jgi:hypothetical protein
VRVDILKGEEVTFEMHGIDAIPSTEWGPLRCSLAHIQKPLLRLWRSKNYFVFGVATSTHLDTGSGPKPGAELIELAVGYPRLLDERESWVIHWTPVLDPPFETECWILPSETEGEQMK